MDTEEKLRKACVEIVSARSRIAEIEWGYCNDYDLCVCGKHNDKEDEAVECWYRYFMLL